MILLTVLSISFLNSYAMMPVKNASEIKYNLEEALHFCNLMNEKYSTVSKVMNSPDFVRVCQWAGWAPTKAAAMTLRGNGSHNFCLSIDAYLEEALVKKKKSNSKKLVDTIRSARSWIRSASENSELSLHSRSESEYEQYMTWTLNQNNKAREEIKKAVALLK